MHSLSSLTTHESRNLKQARPNGQYVDLLRNTLATPPWENTSKVYHLITTVSSVFTTVEKRNSSFFVSNKIINKPGINLAIISSRQT